MTDRTKPLSVAVIGAGMAGRSHANGWRMATTMVDLEGLPPVRLAAIADAHPKVLERATIHVEVADEAALTAYTFGAADVTVHVRTNGVPGSVVLPVLREGRLGAVDYAWICGEAGMVTEGRRHLVKEVGVDRRQVLFSGYWKLGQERG